MASQSDFKLYCKAVIILSSFKQNWVSLILKSFLIRSHISHSFCQTLSKHPVFSLPYIHCGLAPSAPALRWLLPESLGTSFKSRARSPELILISLYYSTLLATLIFLEVILPLGPLLPFLSFCCQLWHFNDLWRVLFIIFWFFFFKPTPPPENT